MIKKIKAFIDKISERLNYSRCYTANEYSGKAVMGICECDNLNCPFNIKREG